MTPKEYYSDVVCQAIKAHFGHRNKLQTDAILSSGFNPKVEIEGDVEIRYGAPIALESDKRILDICDEIRAHYAIEENLDIKPYE